MTSKFDHLRGHLTTAVEHLLHGDGNLVTADSNSSKEGKHVTSGFTQEQSTEVSLVSEHPGVKDTVSQDVERRINSSPLPKMERFYSLFQTCAAATYLCWL